MKNLPFGLKQVAQLHDIILTRMRRVGTPTSDLETPNLPPSYNGNATGMRLPTASHVPRLLLRKGSRRKFGFGVEPDPPNIHPSRLALKG